MLFALSVLAAAAAQATVPIVRPIIIPPVTTMPPPIVAVPVDDVTVARLEPDLVVKEIRIEGDTAVHVLVANEGTGPASNIRVDTDAYIDGRRGEKMFPDFLGSLDVGATAWVKVTGLVPMSEPYYVGKDYSFPLSKVNRVVVDVDPPPGPSWMSPPSGSPWGSPGPKCTAEHGCIKELNEANNSLEVKGDAIVRGVP